jgi:DNA-directed RNA polymerase specialized sigma24 family protein
MPTRSAPPSRAAHRTETRQPGPRHTAHRQTGPRPPGPPARADFDEFYLANRRRLLLQCLALTGDLAASRSAVRDAFVAAAHHWRKVSRLDDPESWVRPHAWGAAQRRSVARIWHREKGLTEQQTAVLDALSKLPEAQRRTILLTYLASAPLAVIGRELALTQAAVERHLQHATAALSLALDCDSTQIRGQLESLAPLVTSPGLPRVTAIRRAARRRQRTHAAVGTLTAVAVALGAGWFVSQPAGHRVRVLTRPVTAAMLLAPAQVQPISPKQTWTVTATGDNTKGDGINTVCQRSRFADDRGIGTWVRRIVASGSPARAVVQTVEVSQSPGAAISTYRTTLGWYAGCTDARVHLTGAYAVRNLGDQAEAVRLVFQPMPRSKAPPVNYVVAVARSGMLTTTTVLQSASPQLAPLGPVLTASASSLRSMCASSAIDECRAGPATVAPNLPRSGEASGMLATVDLPAVASITKPWVGTDPVKGGPNLAATTCDQADFTKAGARPSSRTFLIPEQPGLPQRFGLTETVGAFPTAAAATKFVAEVRARMKTCEKRQLGSRVGQHYEQGKADQLPGATYSMWRQTAEINAKKATVSYWMGIAQRGRWVAQVNFAPAGGDDLDAATFRALVVRARDRLAELS